MSVQVGHLFRKRTVRKLDGSIYILQDDTMGGDIIRGGRVVNQEAINELAAKEKDRETSATEATQVQVPQAVVEERTVAPTKMQELEKKVEGMEDKLDAILQVLKK